MRHATRAAAVVVAVLAAAAPAWPQDGPQDAATPAGAWLTPDGDAVIVISPCGPALCGHIDGIALDHPDDPIPTDYRGRSQCGLAIIRGLRPAGDAWAGEIMDPRNGDIYQARLHREADGTLAVRGYVLMPLLGKTQQWQPYRGELPPDCRMPPTRPAHR